MGSPASRSVASTSLSPDSPSVLFVADVLHPIHRLAVQPFLNGDVRHGRRRRSPVPVLLSRREPDPISGVNLLDRAALPLHPSAAGRHNKRLPEGMGMPGGT